MIQPESICQEQGFCTGGYDMDVFYNDTVTVYNRHEEGYTEKWYPTVLRGVRLLVTKGANMSKSGMDSADSAKLSIITEDTEKPYLPQKEWEKADMEANFTMQAGDFFVRGDTSTEDSEKEDFAEYMKHNYDDCFTVTTVDTYSLIPHIEVGGK